MLDGRASTGERHRVHDPADVALLAAAAPEPVTEQGSLADLRARRDAIRQEMADHEERQGDQWYNDRVDELHYLNRRIQAAEDAAHAAARAQDGKEGK